MQWAPAVHVCAKVVLTLKFIMTLSGVGSLLLQLSAGFEDLGLVLRALVGMLNGVL